MARVPEGRQEGLPDAIPWNIVMVTLHLSSPPTDSIFALPVWKHSIAWPHLSNVLTPVWVVQKHSQVVAVVVDRVIVRGVVWIGDVDCRVDDGDVVLPIGMQACEQRLALGL